MSILLIGSILIGVINIKICIYYAFLFHQHSQGLDCLNRNISVMLHILFVIPVGE
jgi:hypothetical protein